LRSPSARARPVRTTRRAVIVSQPSSEGVAVCVKDLAAAAVNAGIDVTVVCPAGGQLPGWAEQVGASWVDLAMARQPSVADPRHVVRLRRLMVGADLVHLHSSKAGALGRLALLTLPRRRRPASVFTPHAWSWLAGGRLSPLYKAFELAMSGVTDAVVAVSVAEAAQGARSFGRGRGAAIRVIANGVDLQRFNPDGAVAARPADPLIVCVGRLARQKGQDVAIRALHQLSAPNARLRLVGPGDAVERTILEALAAHLGVGDRIEFYGPSSDPAAHMRAADVIVQPSRWEGLSLTMLEAMACGAAVVASEVPGSELLAGAGVVVPPEDPTALARAIDWVLGDASRGRRLGLAARRKVEIEADLSLTLAANLDLWDELVAARRESSERR
jgi:glycosyltransferase involved in cell wall biosynthesis